MACRVVLISCCFWLSLLHLSVNQHVEITVVEHPAPVLVPVNAMAVFSCTAQCTPRSCTLTGEWIVNDKFHLNSPYDHHDQSENELTLNLTINYSDFSDDARVRCFFESNVVHIDSNNATLEWIDDLPLSPNPRLEINMSCLNVTWSPPFLWPGHAIKYFNVSITNKSNGSVTYHKINSNFGDRVVIFTEEIQEEPLMCSEITVNISAISAYSYSTLQQPLQMFSVTHRVLPSPFLFNLSNITVSDNIHPCCDEDNHVDLELNVQLELPRLLCSNQKVNSTFILRNDSNDFVTQVGPLQHNGSSVITENVTHKVEANQTYSLTVQVGYDSHTIANFIYQLDTFVDQSECEQYSTTTKKSDMKPDIKVHDDGLLDYLLIGGSLTLVLGTIIIITTGMCISHCRKRRKERIYEGLRARIQNSLVDNPIYDPMPVYEQIIQLTSPRITTFALIDETERSTQPGPGTCSNHQVNHPSRSVNRYIDQPTCVQNCLQLVNTTETFEHKDPIDQNAHDTFFTKDSAGLCVHSDLDSTLNLDDVNDCDINIDIVGVSDDGATTQRVSASMIPEQGAKVFDTDNCD